MSKLIDFVPDVEVAEGNRRGQFRRISDGVIEYRGARYPCRRKGGRIDLQRRRLRLLELEG